MPKKLLRATAEGRIFQCVIYDSKGKKRGIAVYACGDDVAWADDTLGLFDFDKRHKAPEWLRVAITKPAPDVAQYDWRGDQLQFTGSLEADRDTAPLSPTSPGEGIDEDDETAIRQG